MADPCLTRSLHSLHRLLNLAHKSFHSEMPLVVNSSFVPNSKICQRDQPDALLPQRTLLPRFPASVAQSALTSKHWQHRMPCPSANFKQQPLTPNFPCLLSPLELKSCFIMKTGYFFLKHLNNNTYHTIYMKTRLEYKTHQLLCSNDINIAYT